MGLIPLTVLPFLRKLWFLSHISIWNWWYPDTYDGFGRHFWDVPPERIVPLRKVCHHQHCAVWSCTYDWRLTTQSNWFTVRSSHFRRSRYYSSIFESSRTRCFAGLLWLRCAFWSLMASFICSVSDFNVFQFAQSGRWNPPHVWTHRQWYFLEQDWASSRISSLWCYLSGNWWSWIWVRRGKRPWFSCLPWAHCKFIPSTFLWYSVLTPA